MSHALTINPLYLEVGNYPLNRQGTTRPIDDPERSAYILSVLGRRGWSLVQGSRKASVRPPRWWRSRPTVFPAMPKVHKPFQRPPVPKKPILVGLFYRCLVLRRLHLVSRSDDSETASYGRKVVLSHRGRLEIVIVTRGHKAKGRTRGCIWYGYQLAVACV
ncbi:hypothetical protein P280DRAFT_122270 [Massarina eburnea CBS 473.64]|uniref:Uncharacterized protein n=1 Tax=Massarina eburnea CBS 473.64 TaxID=1395130 RepID=A0A6A6SF67_9PLEO|nr:hypothetical protein P280DRAFT_122270 [Massarina eburnea CBS 473.64]